MGRFSISLAMVLVAGAGVNAQQAGGSAEGRAQVSAQAGQKKVSADVRQETNASIRRSGKSAEVNGGSRSQGGAQGGAQANAGQQGLNLEAGTQLQAVLTSTLDSRRVEEGQQFVLKTTKDVKAGGQRVIRKGSKLIGHVVNARSKVEGEGRSSLLLMVDGVEQGGQVLPLQATFVGVVRQTMQSSLDSDFGSPMSTAPSAPRRSSGGGLLGGGLVGGVTSTVDSTLSATAQTAGSVTGVGTNAGSTVSGAVNSTVSGTAAATGSVTGAAAGAGRTLFSLGNGVTAVASGSVSGATEFTQQGKDLKLEKGTEFVLLVTKE